MAEQTRVEIGGQRCGARAGLTAVHVDMGAAAPN